MTDQETRSTPRSRGRWLAVAAAGAVAAVVVGMQVGGGSAHVPAPASSHGGTSAVVPWAPLPATHPDIPAVTVPASPDPATAAQAPACRASDLRVERRMGAGMGTSYLNIRLSLAGAEPCRLQGYPDIEPMDGDRRLAVPLERRRDDSTYRDPVLVTRSDPARLMLSWASLWCTTPVHNETIRAVLPDGGGSLTFEGFGASPFCNGVPGAGPTPIGVWPFEPDEFRPPEVRSAYSRVEAEPYLDLSASLGQRLRFVITLTSPRRLLLDPCPDYTVDEFARHSSHEETRGLNCAAVPFKDSEGRPYLPAGRPVRFAMEAVAGVRGPGKLGWWLDTPDRAVMLGGQLMVKDPVRPRT